jgi:hypothetical protein
MHPDPIDPHATRGRLIAVGNFLGPLLLGGSFDTIGRRRMISTAFGLAGLLLIVIGVLFASGRLSDVSQTAAWTAILQTV